MRVPLVPTLIVSSLLALAWGCGAAEERSTTATGGGAPGSGGGGGGDGSPCAAGQILDADEGCTSVGIQGCVARFIDEDGICRPSTEKCPAGTVPKFDEGCLPVGIPDCAAEFVEDGFCRPRMAKCPEGAFATPLDGCVPIDGPGGCGTGTWGDIEDDAGNVYVDPTYSGGDGDGSKAKPVQTITEALALVSSGGRIALAEGDYAEPLTIDKPLTLWGRCPSKVTISGSDGDADAPKMIHVTAGPVVVRGVRIAGDGIGVYAEGEAADVTIEGVVVDGPLGGGMVVLEGARATVTSTLIQHARKASFFTEAIGGGIFARHGHVTLERSAVFDTKEHGIAVFREGSSLTLSNVLVEKSTYRGVDLFGGPTATIERTAIVDHRASGVGLDDGTLAISDVVIEDIHGFQGAEGHGLEAVDSVIFDVDQMVDIIPGPANVTVTRAAFLNLHGAAIYAAEYGTTVEVTQTLADGCTGGQFPQVSIFNGAVCEMSDSALARGCVAGVGLFGLFARDGTTTFKAKGLVIEDVEPIHSSGSAGEGILALYEPLLLELDSVVVARARVAGLLAQSEGTVRVSHSLFTSTRKSSSQFEDFVARGTADGIVAQGAKIAIDTTLVESCLRAGMLIDRCEGAVRLSKATKNRYGVVFEGKKTPTLDDVSSFDGNSEEAVLTDTHLQVPKAPAVLPQ